MKIQSFLKIGKKRYSGKILLRNFWSELKLLFIFTITQYILHNLLPFPIFENN